jgi:hypothetical protein
MVSFTFDKEKSVNGRRQGPSRILIIIVVSLLINTGVMGAVVFKRIYIEIGGVEIKNSSLKDSPSDIAFLLMEVKGLKEQRNLLEERLINQLKANEGYQKQLIDCRGKSSFYEY